MEISEIQAPVSQDMASQLAVVFEEAFGEPPSGSFLGRLNEKRDLSVLVAEEEGKIVGFKIGYTRYRGVFFSWLGAVLPGHHRRGIARALLRRQHELCAERGFQEIQTEAAGTNKAMLVLNLQEGFEVSGVHLGHEDNVTVQLRKRLL